MATVAQSLKPLSVNPLKVSSRVGAALAFLGLARCMPLDHGVRGCTAFTKLFFMRHFREPIALQTTAVDEVSTIIGSSERVLEALNTVIERNHPELIGLMVSTLAEFQGADLTLTMNDFRSRYPKHAGVTVIPVFDFEGVDGLEAGYAHALRAIVGELVPESRAASTLPSNVNVIVSSALTAGDVDHLKAWIECFGLHPTVLPDLDDSLNGHLMDNGYQPLTYGGTSRSAFAHMGKAAATIVVGASLSSVADLLRERTGVPDYRFHSLMGVIACDELTDTLAKISRRSVPERLCRQRSRLLDAMVDCQFSTAGATASIAAEPDQLVMLQPFLAESGIRIEQMVAATWAAALETLEATPLIVGDLDDLRSSLLETSSDLILANSHAVALSSELGLPLLRVGYPQHDNVGAHARVWVGYDGTRQALFDVSNLLNQARRQNLPYRSMYRTYPSEHTEHSACVDCRRSVP